MNWKRASVATAVAIPIVVLLGYSMTLDPKTIPSPLPGREAPSFTLPVFSPGEGLQSRAIGDSVRLSDHRGEVVVLNFWASWCLACRYEHTALTEVAERYAGREVYFYGVLYNDAPGNGARWIRDMGGQSYPAVVDPRTRTAIDYGLYGAPETFFIGRDGRVAYKHIGPVTADLLIQKIDSLLALPAPAAPSHGDSAAAVPVPPAGS